MDLPQAAAIVCARFDKASQREYEEDKWCDFEEAGGVSELREALRLIDEDSDGIDLLAVRDIAIKLLAERRKHFEPMGGVYAELAAALRQPPEQGGEG